MSKLQVMFALGGKNPYGPGSLIELLRCGADGYAVRHGSQLSDELTYPQAAQQLGYCIMHLTSTGEEV